MSYYDIPDIEPGELDRPIPQLMIKIGEIKNQRNIEKNI